MPNNGTHFEKCIICQIPWLCVLISKFHDPSKFQLRLTCQLLNYFSDGQKVKHIYMNLLWKSTCMLKKFNLLKACEITSYHVYHSDTEHKTRKYSEQAGNTWKKKKSLKMCMSSVAFYYFLFLSCTLIESHMLIGCLLPDMNSYSLLVKQKQLFPLLGDDVYLISPLRLRCVSHISDFDQSSVSNIPSWEIKCISYPFSGNQMYLISNTG